MKMGFSEILVILTVAFVVLGPERTVIYARKLGHILRALKIYIDSFTDDIRENVTEPLSELTEPLEDAKRAIQEPLQEVASSIQKPLEEARSTLQKDETRPKAPAAPEPEDELEEAIPMETTAEPASRG